MYTAAVGFGLTGVVFAGGIFGFFYAWVCSTMWGLDSADPKVAIAAMQAMNASVRNIVFAPAFFGTPFVLGLAGILSCLCKRRPAGRFFFAAAFVYFIGGMALTMLINVPMNRELANVAIPASTTQARELWSAYSGDWQAWNQARTLFAGIALALAGTGLILLGTGSDEPDGRTPA